MKHLILMMSLCFTSALWAQGSALEAVEAFHHALTHGDRAAALALLHKDVVIYESGHKESSREEYSSHHLDSDIAFSKEVSRKVTKQSSYAAGAQQVVLMETETQGNYKGKAVHLIGLETLLLEKNENQWQIKHVHWSSRKAH